MTKARIPKQQTTNRQVNQLQDDVSSATAILRNGPFGDGQLIGSLIFPYDAALAPSYQHATAVPNIVLVDHGLDRQWQGFVVLGQVQPFNSTIATLIIVEDAMAQLGYPIDGTKQVAFQLFQPCLIPDGIAVDPVNLAVWLF
jgi:hypothetical protein